MQKQRISDFFSVTSPARLSYCSFLTFAISRKFRQFALGGFFYPIRWVSRFRLWRRHTMPLVVHCILGTEKNARSSFTFVCISLNFLNFFTYHLSLSFGIARWPPAGFAANIPNLSRFSYAPPETPRFQFVIRFLSLAFSRKFCIMMLT